MAAISGTFNMIDPDRRGACETACGGSDVLASACRWLGTTIITLCTGTRDPDDMWRGIPTTTRRGLGASSCESCDEAVEIAEPHEVTLAIEPEIANVVDSAVKARRLLEEIGSPWLKVVIDPANLFHAGDLPRMREVLDEAFELLGPDIVLAHAKDLSRDGEAGHEAAGHGACSTRTITSTCSAPARLSRPADPPRPRRVRRSRRAWPSSVGEARAFRGRQGPS